MYFVPIRQNDKCLSTSCSIVPTSQRKTAAKGCEEQRPRAVIVKSPPERPKTAGCCTPPKSVN